MKWSSEPPKEAGRYLVRMTKPRADLLLAVVDAARRVAGYFDPEDGGQGDIERDGANLVESLAALDADPGVTVEQLALAIGLAYYPDPREPTAADMEAARAALRAVGYSE